MLLAAAPVKGVILGEAIALSVAFAYEVGCIAAAVLVARNPVVIRTTEVREDVSVRERVDELIDVGSFSASGVSGLELDALPPVMALGSGLAEATEADVGLFPILFASPELLDEVTEEETG